MSYIILSFHKTSVYCFVKLLFTYSFIIFHIVNCNTSLKKKKIVELGYPKMEKHILIPRKSRTEINIGRLLIRCEVLAKENSHQNWRLEEYIHTLDDALNKLQLSDDKSSRDAIGDYVKRIDFLKGVIDMEKLTNPIEKVVAVQMLPKTSTLLTNISEPNIVTQIHQKTAAKYNRELRSELLNCGSDANIRQRLRSVSTHDQDFDAILKYNRNTQEKIAENMILITSNMKEHALTANSIIKKDMIALEKSDELTEVNTAHLKAESLKLEEHTKSNWRCWVWLMVALVLIIFFNMIFFMKMAKKRI